MNSMAQYRWPGPYKPFDHQVVTAEFLFANNRSFVLNDMGTGKTSSALWAMDHLLDLGDVNRALIVAPLSTLTRVWQDEAFRVLTHRSTALLYGPAKKRKDLYASDHWEIGIVNFDGVKILADQIAADPWLDLIVVDEATAYRNAQTDRFKLFYKLTREINRLWLMTGTPCPQAPTDAFALAKLIGNPDTPKFFGSFRRQTMRQVTQFKWVPRSDGYDKAFKLLQPAVRFKKSECIDLPPVTEQDWVVSLTKVQLAAYKQMQKAMRLEWADSAGELPAVNAADKINKLRQIACGVIRDTETGEYLNLNHKHRLDATLEAIEQASAKSIVVVPFKGIINQLAKEIGAHHTVAVINGDVSVKRRNEIITAFSHTPDPKVLLVHPKVMSHGLTLTEADTMVFYGPIYSNEESRQIVERINRPGQTRKMTIIKLGSTALEWEIYAAVELRAQGEAYLLNMYESAAKEKPETA